MPLKTTRTCALHATASDSPNAKKMIPHKSAIAARLYHVLSLSTLAATLIVANTDVKAQSKLPAPAAKSAPKSTVKLSAQVQRVSPLPDIDEQFSRPVAPGIELTTITRRNARGPLQLFVTRVNLNPENADVRYKLQLATAEYSVLKAATVSAMAKKQNAVVAINGGYFAFGGAALGAVKVENEWLRLPMKNRTAMGFSPEGGVVVAPLDAGARATFGSRVVAREIADGAIDSLFTNVSIDNLNGFAPENGVTLVTTRFGTVYKLRPDEVALEIDGSVVRARVETGAANVRPNGWTLIARGAARDVIASIAPGQAATWQVQAPTAWQKYSTILGAGPRLLRDGKIETTEVIEEFRPDVVARGPRSAIGIDRSGQLWFVAVDGRAPEYSVGLTLPELALEMQKLGCVEAICLDGGGSTAMVINGILVNRPSDGSERRVPNALIVTSDGTMNF